MSVGLLIITHANTGERLLQTVRKMLGTLPLRATSIAVDTDCNHHIISTRIQQTADSLNDGEGLLVLTDLFGSTPSNMAHTIRTGYPVTVITGINLSMLVRLMNYPTLALHQLAEKAISGAHDGIRKTTR